MTMRPGSLTGKTPHSSPLATLKTVALAANARAIGEDHGKCKPGSPQQRSKGVAKFLNQILHARQPRLEEMSVEETTHAMRRKFAVPIPLPSRQP